VELLSDLPNGSSGRSPFKAIDILNHQSKDSRSLLVLFEDGTLGKWDDNGIITSDGSEYTMIFYSHEQLGNIDVNKYDSKKEKLFLNLQLGIYISSLLLYALIRYNYDFPSFFPLGYNSIVILIFVPTLFFFWAVTNLFTYSDGDIVVHLINSDPHYFTTLSSSFNIVKTLITNIFIIQLICFYYFYYQVSYTILPDIIVLLLTFFLIFNLYSPQKIGEISDFIDSFNSLHEKINTKKRVENPLLNLLMDNESPTLEFKASLWSSYHGVTGDLVGNQKDKNFALQDSVLKTVAGFLNTIGGTLLIGIKDKPRSDENVVAEVLGIESDFRWLKKGKRDTEGFEHVLIELFNNSLSNSASNQYISITFPEYENRVICRIDVQSLPRRVGQQCFAETKTMGKKLFVRSGDSTIPQSRETEYDYIRHHFEGFSGENNLDDI
jgi:hypothetical protein